jgi:hypothetical protein
MRRNLISGAMAAVAMVALAPRGARACGQGNSYGGYMVFALAAAVGGLADVGLSVWDLTTVFGGNPPSATYGAVELLVALPQLALGISGLTLSPGSSIFRGSSFFTGYTIWMAALTAHGIWSIAAASPAHSAPDVPVPDPNPPPDSSGGVKMTFGPTYVPLGPLAQVGFGLSGRF